MEREKTKNYYILVLPNMDTKNDVRIVSIKQKTTPIPVIGYDTPEGASESAEALSEKYPEHAFFVTSRLSMQFE